MIEPYFAIGIGWKAGNLPGRQSTVSSMATPSKFWIGGGMGAAGIVTAGGNCVALLSGPIGRSGNISLSSQSLSSSF